MFWFTSAAQQACSRSISATQTDQSIVRQHTKAPRERSKSIKSSLLSNRSRSTQCLAPTSPCRRRSIPNKPKQTIYNGRHCVAIDVHGFANLHQHLNTANQTCSRLAAISTMAIQSFCLHGNPSPWHKRFFLLAQQCFGATYDSLFLVRRWCFGCRKTKNRFETRLCLRTSTGTALVEKGYVCSGPKQLKRTKMQSRDNIRFTCWLDVSLNKFPNCFSIGQKECASSNGASGSNQRRE